jgi:hypothetical protein
MLYPIIIDFAHEYNLQYDCDLAFCFRHAVTDPIVTRIRFADKPPTASPKFECRLKYPGFGGGGP